MSDELRTAFLLMSVGMITVFLVLFCVVMVGKLLIYYVNRYIPLNSPVSNLQHTQAKITPTTMAAITSAVEIFTKGKGKIININKIK